MDDKPSAPPGDETDAEDFAIWEDDDVAEEQEQADEVAEEPVFAKDGPPHHVEEEPRPEEPPAPAMCKWLPLRLVHGSASAKDLTGPSVDDRGSTSTCRRVQAASAHLPDDYHRARSTDGVRRLLASVRRRSEKERAANCMIVAVPSFFVASRSEILFQLLLSSFVEES